MPTYSYRCLKCDYTFDTQSIMAECSNPKCCPNCGEYDSKIIITAGVGFGDPIRMGRQKVSNSFRDTLINIKENNPKSNIDVK